LVSSIDTPFNIDSADFLEYGAKNSVLKFRTPVRQGIIRVDCNHWQTVIAFFDAYLKDWQKVKVFWIPAFARMTVD